MAAWFPELTEKQVEEKVRGALRRNDRYHVTLNTRESKDRFFFVSGYDVHLYIVSDTHIGAGGFQRTAFKKYVRQIADDPYAAVLVLGDLIDNATLGSKGCVYGQRMTPQKQIETAIDLLSPIKDKIVFVCPGNHEQRTFRQTGTDPCYTICLGLGCLDKYNPVHGYITISAAGKSFKIYATHNIGKTEARLKAIARSHSDCDLVIGGHIHTSKVVAVAQQLFGGNIKTTYAITGKAWLKDEAYAISAAYEPVSDIQPVIFLGESLKVVQ